MRMIPLSTLFERFPKLVRDLSRQLNKKIKFVVEGGETRLDMFPFLTVFPAILLLSILSCPLSHLLSPAINLTDISLLCFCLYHCNSYLSHTLIISYFLSHLSNRFDVFLLFLGKNCFLYLWGLIIQILS